LFQAGFSSRWKLRPENGYRADIARVNKTSGDTATDRCSNAAVDDPVRRRQTVKPGQQRVYRQLPLAEAPSPAQQNGLPKERRAGR
jgi:hypothetical protein